MRISTGRFSGRVLVLIALWLQLSACMVGPDYVRPAVKTTTHWLDSEDRRLKALAGDNQYWWKNFNDPILNQLVERAYRDNLTIQIAGARLLEARAQLGVAVGDLYPQTQQIVGDLTTINISRHASQAVFSRLFHYAQTQLGLSASWELDFWGKFRRSIESSKASLNAAEADYDNALVSLIADVARTYIAIRTLEKRLSIAKQNLTIQQQTLKIADIRFQGGTTSGRDVEQAKTVLANTKASIPTLTSALRQQLNALSVLMGQAPQAMKALLTQPGAIPTPPMQIAVGIPADLLRRRPDVRQAEQEAAAQSAAIGVTEASLYPAFSLSGTFGFLSTDAGSFSLGDIFAWKSRFVNFGPAVQWNIFNYGQITNQVRVQDARFQALLMTYQNTVLTAQREVEDNMAAFLNSQDRAHLLGESTAAAQRSLNLATIQYREGITDFTTVLTAHQSLLSEQDSLASTLGDIATSLVGVYRALGGGWQMRETHDVLPEHIKVQMAKRTDWDGLLTPAAASSSEKNSSSRINWPHW
jgi:NodT family efflux transporter outer membrane factor (OMF) lipoprotein